MAGSSSSSSAVFVSSFFSSSLGSEALLARDGVHVEVLTGADEFSHPGLIVFVVVPTLLLLGTDIPVWMIINEAMMTTGLTTAMTHTTT